MAPVEGSQRYSQPACNHLSKKLGNYDELIDDYLVGKDLKMRVTRLLHCSIDGTEYFGTLPRRRFQRSSGTIALSNINVSFKLSRKMMAQVTKPQCSSTKTSDLLTDRTFGGTGGRLPEVLPTHMQPSVQEAWRV